MSHWIPGYKLREGPNVTGLALRFLGQRDQDKTHAWIRVDGHMPGDRGGAEAIASVYEATARLDHPDLPAVLDYGFTAVAGRPFLAFQLERGHSVSEERSFLYDPYRAAGLLAEVHSVALDCGLAGIYVPPHELDRIRGRVEVEGRRIPLWEFLAEPRRPDGLCGLYGVVDETEWAPYTAPELWVRHKHKPAARPAAAYRLAAQLHHLLYGKAPDPPKTDGGDVTRITNPGIVRGDRGDRKDLDRAIRAALQANPARRPGLESFMYSVAVA